MPSGSAISSPYPSLPLCRSVVASASLEAVAASAPGAVASTSTVPASATPAPVMAERLAKSLRVSGIGSLLVVHGWRGSWVGNAPSVTFPPFSKRKLN